MILTRPLQGYRGFARHRPVLLWSCRETYQGRAGRNWLVIHQQQVNTQLSKEHVMYAVWQGHVVPASCALGRASPARTSPPLVMFPVLGRIGRVDSTHTRMAASQTSESTRSKTPAAYDARTLSLARVATGNVCTRHAYVRNSKECPRWPCRMLCKPTLRVASRRGEEGSNASIRKRCRGRLPGGHWQG